jgi:hypothetical protein
MGLNNPPQIQPTIKVGHRFRFVINGAGGSSQVFTIQDICDLLCVATAATVAYRLFDAVKLKKIEAWAANSAGNASNTLELEWIKTLVIGGPGLSVTDTAMGLANIAHICSRPPMGSRASEWLSTASLAAGSDIDLFRLVVPQGSIVDVEIEGCFYDTDIPVLVTGAVAGATTGKTYCRALDSAAGTALFVPIGFDTI